MAEAGFDWAQRFDEDARAVMLEDPPRSPRSTGHGDFAAAVPTPDHFIPLLYLAGLAGEASRAADVLVDGYAARSLSMTAYTLDAACPPAAARGRGAAALPDDLDQGDQRLTDPMSLAVSMGLAAVVGPLPDSETVAFQLTQRSRPRRVCWISMLGSG